MISIARPSKPDGWDAKVTEAVKVLFAAHRADRSASLHFRESIYRSKEVRDAYIEAQNRKCAYCEHYIGDDHPGDVEHFRPKAGYKQDESNHSLISPGYFWLAYSWDNLLLSCWRCNNHKANWFPLVDPKKRAKPTQRNLSQEQPLLIDPTSVKPELHIRFREHVATPVNGSRHGSTTIEILDLNRTKRDGKNKNPVDRRKESYLRLQNDWTNWRKLQLLSTRRSDPELQEVIRSYQNQFRQAIHPSAEYSAMARDFLASVGFSNDRS